MKILFFNHIINEYECTLLLHGLYQLENIEIFLFNDIPWLFTGEKIDIKSLYGKGFNLVNLISSEKKQIHTQEQIIKNLEEHWYDLIIYGCAYEETPFLENVIKSYSKNEIFFIDGADEDFGFKKNYTTFHGLLKCMIPFWYIPLKMKKRALYLSKLGLYFKREISNHYSKKFIPISFAYPEQLFIKNLDFIKKKILMADLIPGKKETYIYNDSEEYNKSYQSAMFGTTFKKAGWDCYRHYEILANGCIPYFPDIEKCPDNTMFLFPKKILTITNNLYIRWEKSSFNHKDEKIYKFYQKLLFNYAKENLTTKKLAEYVLSFFYKNRTTKY